MKNLFNIFKSIAPNYRYMSFDDSGGGDPPPKKGDNQPTGYTEEEVNQRVEAARRDEKAKLYEELNGLRKNKDALQTELDNAKGQVETLNQQIETLKSEKVDLQNKHDALVAAQKEDGAVDTEKLIKEVTDRIRNEYEQTQGKTNKELRAEIERLRQEKRVSDLKAYRQLKIAEAGEDIISEMVSGNSEEEIDRSIEAAKDAYGKYIKKSTNDTTGGGTPPPPPPASKSGGTASTSTPSGGLEGFQRFQNPNEYAKNRDTILQQVRQRFK